MGSCGPADHMVIGLFPYCPTAHDLPERRFQPTSGLKNDQPDRTRWTVHFARAQRDSVLIIGPRSGLCFLRCPVPCSAHVEPVAV